MHKFDFVVESKRENIRKHESKNGTFALTSPGAVFICQERCPWCPSSHPSFFKPSKNFSKFSPQ